MNRSPRRRAALLAGLFVLAAATALPAQQRVPHIGYAYPAGAQKGETVEIRVGGQYLDRVSHVLLSGEGVVADVVEHKKPLSKKQLNDLNSKLRELRKKKQSAIKKGKENATMAGGLESFKSFARSIGLQDLDLNKFLEIRKQLTDPKRQPNPQIAEVVTVRLMVKKDAAPGLRELRMRTPLGFTNPIFIRVGQWPECREQEPNDKRAAGGPESLPAVLNGQIMPGDVDRFRFTARRGMRLVAAVSARELTPYLADAVPGWFQAVLTLYDAKGNVVAYQDDFRFHPDPVVCYEVPADGEYELEIRDAIYRGREDFVYRISLGELPFVTGVFPLGGRAGSKTPVELAGWNLPTPKLTVNASKAGPGTLPVSVKQDGRESNRVPFALDALPEIQEREANDGPGRAQRIQLPMVVNGRIDRPGDVDCFRIDGRAGSKIVAEIHARRLESPLDSVLRLTDGRGKLVAANDDHEDKGAGLTTHHADSLLLATLPASGTYHLYVGDTQGHGGPAYAYRLRVAMPRPDFALRVTPSRVNARAGSTVPIAVYALRQDGFDGPIDLALKEAPEGFLLGGARIPAGCDGVRLTMTFPPQVQRDPFTMSLVGVATIDGKETIRTALPAEDMMQAFIYRHLVPMESWEIVMTGGGRRGPPLRVLGDGPTGIPAGGSGRVRIAAPMGPYMKKITVELSEPPEGIAIRKVFHDKSSVVVEFSADAGKVKPGLKGNLILNAFTEYAPKGKDGKKRPARRVPIGALPAVPFEIVASSAKP